MGYVDDILDEFSGHLSVNDIYHMTYKEIGYLRKHRQELNKRKNNITQESENLLPKV